MVIGFEVDLVSKVALAAFLGGLIGLEREIHKKPGGLRTHALVCMGATLFTVVSFAFTEPTVDSRIAASIVTGIGFLAAGMIIKNGNNIKGYTTAAELWVLAAIGIAVGVGFYLVAGVTTLLVLLILDPVKWAEGIFSKKKR